MERRECPSYPIQIWIAGSAAKAEEICLAYCEAVGFCVTVTETRYVYRGRPDSDDGVVVGLINYPRFPATPAQIWDHAEKLAEGLRVGMGQESYTIQAPDKSVWISYRS